MQYEDTWLFMVTQDYVDYLYGLEDTVSYMKRMELYDIVRGVQIRSRNCQFLYTTRVAYRSCSLFSNMQQFWKSFTPHRCQNSEYILSPPRQELTLVQGLIVFTIGDLVSEVVEDLEVMLMYALPITTIFVNKDWYERQTLGKDRQSFPPGVRRNRYNLVGAYYGLASSVYDIHLHEVDEAMQKGVTCLSI